MEYNSTKRKVELAAGIIGIITNVIYIIIACIALVIGFIMLFNAGPGHYYFGHVVLSSTPGLVTILLGLFFIAMPVVMLVFSIKLVKSPYSPNGEIKNKQGARIIMLIFSILLSNTVVMALMIAVLCLKDVKDTNVTTNAQAQQTGNKQLNDFTSKVQELKRLKDAGIIDEETYKIAIAKITENL